VKKRNGARWTGLLIFGVLAVLWIGWLNFSSRAPAGR
jgi:hypothetical protein